MLDGLGPDHLEVVSGKELQLLPCFEVLQKYELLEEVHDCAPVVLALVTNYNGRHLEDQTLIDEEVLEVADDLLPLLVVLLRVAGE